MMAPVALVRRMGADLLESTFELEHGNIELAKTSRVSNDIEPSDLGVHEGEYHRLGQFAEGREYQSDGSIDERRLHESHPSRERD